MNETPEMSFDKKPRKKMTFTRALKYFVLSLSAAVYIMFFVRFFVSCDSKISDDVYLTEKQAEKFQNLDVILPVYHYQPVEWVTEDGGIEVKNIYYIEDYNSLQLTVKSKDKINGYDGERPFEFKLRVTGDKENEKEIVPRVYTDKRFGYTHMRLVADEAVCDMGKSVEVPITTYDAEGNPTASTETEIKGGTQVYLDVYSLGGERICTFEVAGKNTARAQIRRAGIDVNITD